MVAAPAQSMLRGAEAEEECLVGVQRYAREKAAMERPEAVQKYHGHRIVGRPAVTHMPAKRPRGALAEQNPRTMLRRGPEG